MKTRSRPPHPPIRLRQGFTLVEVVIALALFVVGALAIVQIFPPALAVIRNNESINKATMLGTKTLNQSLNPHSPPPEAIYDVDAAAAWQDFPAGISPRSSRSSTLPQTPLESDYQKTALGHFRYIYGEPHYFGNYSYHVLLNHPRAFNAGQPADPEIPVTGFFDDEVKGVQIDVNGFLDFRNAHLLSSPGTPFNNPSSPTRPPTSWRRPDSIYYISYRWRECGDVTCTGTPKINGVMEEPVSMPLDGSWDNTYSARVLACKPSTYNRAIPGAVTVKVRRYVTVTTVTSGDSQNAIATLRISSPTPPGIYYLSYLASDWRSMVDDSIPVRKQPASNTGVVNLPLTNLDDTYPASANGVVSASLTRSDYQQAPVNLMAAAPTVDKKKGEVEYNISSTPINYWLAPRVRTVYRVLDNWTHQLSVSPRYYIPYDANRAGDANYPQEPWREYAWNISDPAIMYFHPSEAGKTVSLTYMDAATPPNIIESVCTIDDDLIDKPGSVPANFIGPGNGNPGFSGNYATSKVARLYISNTIGTNVSAQSILSVQGLSIRARTAWLNKDRYTQVIVPGFRKLDQ